MKEFILNLQLFAEDTEDTPTEQVESKPSATNDEGEDEPNFNDGEEQVQEEGTEEETSKKEKNPKTKASSNNANAQKRIAQKKEEERKRQEEQKKREREITLKAYKDATNGINKFTNKPIEDEDDVEEYRIMLELDKAGKDPIEDYPQYIKEMRKKERETAQKKLEEERSKTLKMEEEQKAFDKIYGQGAMAKAFQDEEFLKFATDMMNEGTTPKTAYRYYLSLKENKEKMNDEIEKKAQDLAIEKDARRQASPGGLSGEGATKTKDFKNMSSEEFKAYRDNILQQG